MLVILLCPTLVMLAGDS
uniref:Uncharacterized protein n=1 Tax=Anguilla anguilla TaxID=7936 RepID=A0A0E9UMH4_ANGAN